MDNAEKIFELKDVSFSYQDTTALKNINFTIRRGEKIAILGANGCGKTTLLRILAGLSVPGSGTFCAFGERITRKRLDDDRFSCDYHRRVGFIFQNSDTQLFCTSVREEIAFGPLQTGLSREEVLRRVEDVAKLLGIEPLLDKAPFNLSGGEKKKVTVASVLALSPDVLVLDEPTNGLDPRSQRWLVNLLLALSRAGKTLVTSTHNLDLVGELSERAILFGEDHTIAADRPTPDVLCDAELLRRVNLVDENYRPDINI